MLGALTEGGNLVYNSVTVGTVTTNSGGTLLLTFNATADQAAVNGVLQSISYSNSSDTPPTSVRIDWTFNDNNDGSQGSGGTLNATGSTTVNITATNDAPVVTVSSVDLNFTEQSPVGIDVSATISDVDDADLEGAVIQITSNYESGFDELSFTNQNGISGVWDSGSGTLTLSGTATVAEYESAIQSIAFYNSSDQPSLLTRTVQWTVNDGDTDSVSVTRDILMNAVNDEEVLATNTGTTVSEGSTGTVISTAMLHTTDVDNSDTQLVYTVDAVTSNGTLRFNGTALGVNDTFTQADIDAGNVTYDHDGSQTSADSFDFTVDDGAGTSYFEYVQLHGHQRQRHSDQHGSRCPGGR